MRKWISICIVLAAMFSGGCLLDEAVARLGNFPDHVEVFTVDNGDWANGFIGFRFVDNPLNSLPVR